MKRRTITLPVLNGNIAGWILSIMAVSITVGVAAGLLNSPARILTAVNGLLLPWAYSLYSLVRIGDHDGKPMEIGIGKKLPALPTLAEQAEAIRAAERLPAAFPPEPHQCYVCGMVDPHYKDVFETNSDAHWACEEWLGNWEPRPWTVYAETTVLRRNPVYGRYLQLRYIADSDCGIPMYTEHAEIRQLLITTGWQTPEEIEDYCAREFAGSRLVRAERPGYGNFGPTVIDLTHLNKENAR